MLCICAMSLWVTLTECCKSHMASCWRLDTSSAAVTAGALFKMKSTMLNHDLGAASTQGTYDCLYYKCDISIKGIGSTWTKVFHLTRGIIQPYSNLLKLYILKMLPKIYMIVLTCWVYASFSFPWENTTWMAGLHSANCVNKTMHSIPYCGKNKLNYWTFLNTWDVVSLQLSVLM